MQNISIILTEQQIAVAINLMRLGAKGCDNNEFDGAVASYLVLREVFVGAVKKEQEAQSDQSESNVVDIRHSAE